MLNQDELGLSFLFCKFFKIRERLLWNKDLASNLMYVQEFSYVIYNSSSKLGLHILKFCVNHASIRELFKVSKSGIVHSVK